MDHQCFDKQKEIAIGPSMTSNNYSWQRYGDGNSEGKRSSVVKDDGDGDGDGDGEGDGDSNWNGHAIKDSYGDGDWNGNAMKDSDGDGDWYGTI